MTGPGVPSADVLPVYGAALCALAAVWLLLGQEYGLRRARLLTAGPLAEGVRRRTGSGSGSGSGFRGGSPGAGLLRRREWWPASAGAVLSALTLSPVPLLVAALALPLVRRRLRRLRERAEADARVEAVIGLCGAVAGELRAGQLPEQALLTSGAPGLGADVDASLRASARFGGDIVGALADAARMPGAAGLRGVAACWQVASVGGASLAAGLERLAAGLRADAEQRAEVRALLAGPRCTAVVLALLPVVGLALGVVMGADPLRVLLHSGAGWVCLAVGGVLQMAGLAWVGLLVRAAEGGGPR